MDMKDTLDFELGTQKSTFLKKNTFSSEYSTVVEILTQKYLLQKVWVTNYILNIYDPSPKSKLAELQSYEVRTTMDDLW